MKHRIPRKLYWIALALVLALVGVVIGVRQAYYHNLRPLNDNQQTVIVEIPSGSSVQEIADMLVEKKVTRNNWSFEWYVHSKELTNKLQAGTYALSSSSDIPTIVKTLTKGRVATKLITILPGKRIDQVRAGLINDGFSVEAVDSAMQPAQYRDLPVMRFVPADAQNLEGLLFPDSFQRDQSTTPHHIIRQSLKAMGDKLTPDVQSALAQRGLTVYQGLILASMVEKEVSKQNERDQVAQVFLLRLQKDMSLGSDVTALYGSIMAGQGTKLRYDTPYNTLINKGLPPGPISSISESSLSSVVNPAQTDWLFFVSGDAGITRFQHTNEQHQADAQKYCHKLCGR